MTGTNPGSSKPVGDSIGGILSTTRAKTPFVVLRSQPLVHGMTPSGPLITHTRRAHGLLTPLVTADDGSVSESQARR